MTFDYPGYQLIFVQKAPCDDASAHLFTLIYTFFSPVTQYKYVLRADYHQEDVFAIKFYCKKDKRSDFKYSKIVNRGDLGNIMITCLSVIPQLLNQYPTASFSFIGSPTLDPVSKKLEPPINNQRFRTYLYLVAAKIGTGTFYHKDYPHISGYVLINRLAINPALKEVEIKSMFQRTYNNVHDIP